MKPRKFPLRISPVCVPENHKAVLSSVPIADARLLQIVPQAPEVDMGTKLQTESSWFSVYHPLQSGEDNARHTDIAITECTVKMVRQGLDPNYAFQVQELLGANQETIRNIFCVSYRTLQRKRSKR